MLQWKSDRWLTAERLRIYPRLLVFSYICGFIVWAYLATGKVDVTGRPLGADFISFYAAGKLALEGLAPLAYDFTAHYAMEQNIIGSLNFDYPSFSYPPIFLLLLAPLAKLPYLPALFIFQFFSLLLFVFMINKLAGRNKAIMLCLAFPAVFINLGYGQNAFLTTGLLAGALFYIDRRPIVSGILIGLLTFKPHLGVLIPFVLILSGRWRVFIVATIIFVSLVLLSYLVFGMETWQAFWEGRYFIKRVLEEEIVAYNIMQSMFTGIRSMGASVATAYLLHILTAVVALVSVCWVWSCQVDIRLKVAILAIGTLMITPYILNYDLMIIAISIACLTSYCLEFGFRPGLINLLFISWFAPALARPLNYMVPFPWTSLLLSLTIYQILMITKDRHRNSNKLGRVTEP